MPRRLPAADRQSAERPHSRRLCLEPLEERLPTGVMLGLLGGDWSMVSAFWVEEAYSPGPEIAGAEQPSDIGRSDQTSDEVIPGSLTPPQGMTEARAIPTQSVPVALISGTKSSAPQAADWSPFGLSVLADQDSEGGAQELGDAFCCRGR